MSELNSTQGPHGAPEGAGGPEGAGEERGKPGRVAKGEKQLMQMRES